MGDHSDHSDRSDRNDRDDARPPRAPEPGRSLRTERREVLTAMVLVLIVVSAMLGAYDGHAESSAPPRASGLEVQVRYTTRLRFQNVNLVEVVVHNGGSQILRNVRVAVDTAYMSGFSEIVIQPEPQFPFVAELAEVPAGASRLVRVQARGTGFGRHRGRVTVTTLRDTVQLPVSTLVLP
jgi:hypothetical protein